MMTTEQKLIDTFGGLDKVKQLITTHALDDIFCHVTGRWYTAKYWYDKQMNPGFGATTIKNLYDAFHGVQKIMFIGGASHGRLMYFNNIQDIVKMPHPKPMTPIYDYSKYSEYATDIAVPIQESIDTYQVEVFRFNEYKRKFLVIQQYLNLNQEQLLKFIKENWQYGYRF
ncbi:hypothetical protein [Acinetobacter bereziniae]|uniref:hypothetical protein n=1 Tax=Acinetobacter bereziniae TaxID=106648 RepID=UPI003018F9D2